RVMGSGEGYGIAVECTREVGRQEKPWEEAGKVLAGKWLWYVYG
ncbi:hypothetical protein Tco_0430095, partial [Tanacetum coccineum]